MSENVYESPKAELQTDDDEAVTISTKELFFSFKGRITRGKYWFGSVMLFVSMMALGVILAILGLSEQATGIIFLLFYIPVVWASLAIQVKRWHDRNKSGWWVFINLVPLIGPFWALIENGFLAGDGFNNNYGPRCA